MSRRGYHHGDLPRALRRAALAQVASGAITTVSIAGAARAAGVSPGAPYQHYRDREELLVDVAAAGFSEMGERFAEVDDDLPGDRLASYAAAYVEFAVADPAHFQVMRAFASLVMADPERSAATTSTLRPVSDAARAAVGPERAPTVTATVFALAVGFSEIATTPIAREQLGVGAGGLAAEARRAVAALLA